MVSAPVLWKATAARSQNRLGENVCASLEKDVAQKKQRRNKKHQGVTKGKAGIEELDVPGTKTVVHEFHRYASSALLHPS